MTFTAVPRIKALQESEQVHIKHDALFV